MIRFTIDTKVCKGCGLCVDACAKHLLKLDPDHLTEKGYSPACMTDESACIGCKCCALTCPDVAITIEKL